MDGAWRSPAAKLSGADQGKLLCAMYAWDGGAYPGAFALCVALSPSECAGASVCVDVRFQCVSGFCRAWLAVRAGNEFYEPYGMLSGSGDPAAACCRSTPSTHTTAQTMLEQTMWRAAV